MAREQRLGDAGDGRCEMQRTDGDGPPRPGQLRAVSIGSRPEDPNVPAREGFSELAWRGDQLRTERARRRARLEESREDLAAARIENRQDWNRWGFVDWAAWGASRLVECLLGRDRAQRRNPVQSPARPDRQPARRADAHAKPRQASRTARHHDGIAIAQGQVRRGERGFGQRQYAVRTSTRGRGPDLREQLPVMRDGDARRR